jgi:hypothetical protein
MLELKAKKSRELRMPSKARTTMSHQEMQVGNQIEQKEMQMCEVEQE